MDLPECCGEQGTMKPGETDPSNRHGRQGGRIRNQVVLFADE